MIEVYETRIGADGAVLSHASIGAIFLHRHTAVRFLHVSLPEEFKNGKHGYAYGEDYWWGCHPDPEAVIHRYTIVEGMEPGCA
jgi:hypothetical protein